MSAQTKLLDTCENLKTDLAKNMKKKTALELKINGQFQRLKMVETSLEKLALNREGDCLVEKDSFSCRRK